MSYLVLVTYDLRRPYRHACVIQGLHGLGLRQTIRVAGGREIRLPNNTAGAIVPTDGAPTADRLRDRLTRQIERLFDVCDAHGRFFVGVGSRWAWSKRVIT
jgi:hypothetical protein